LRGSHFLCDCRAERVHRDTKTSEKRRFEHFRVHYLPPRLFN